MSRSQLAGGWCGAMIVAGAVGVVAGVDLTISSLELLVATCLVPPAVLLLQWHRVQPVTVADVLHGASRPPSDTRPTA